MIMLVCHSLEAKQLVLHIFSQEADSMDFSFRARKSLLLGLVHVIYPVSQKTRHPSLAHNFAGCLPANSAVNVPCK